MKTVFLHSPELEKYPYPANCPFNTSRAGLLHKKLMSMGLLSGRDIEQVAPMVAGRTDLEKFHHREYLDALEKAGRGHFEMDMLYMGIGTGDNPVFEGLYDYALLACGATITGAELILSGKANIAFNPSGGYHHAHAAMAAGFCYVNDVVLGCMKLAERGRRVLYIDIDVHHGDGVQEAFYDRNDVMTISLHEDGRALFPGTGFTHEIGEGAGKGYSVNVPLPAGTFDRAYIRAFRQVVLPLEQAFNPDVIVMELGADGLAGDPLAHLLLTNNVYADIVDIVRGFGKPILATGGGGYHIENTVRAWALCWNVLCGQAVGHDMTAGMGGVMLESTDWQGGLGLRDRVLVPDQRQRLEVEPIIDSVIEDVKKRVFGFHGL